MKTPIRMPAVAVTVSAILLLAYSQGANSEPAPPFERTENFPACDDYDPMKQPLFGETHLHTSYSFDAYNLSVRNDPAAAYAFAKGGEITLPAADARRGIPQTRTAQLRRPIDFAALTDHSELFGPMQICTRSDPETTGYDSIYCKQERSGELEPGVAETYNPALVTTRWGFKPVLQPEGRGAAPLPLCDEDGVDCGAAEVSMWQDIQQAAADAYQPCSFTSFVAYEFTAQPLFSNLHRNVIFRNANVPEAPVTNITTNGPFPISPLWDGLQQSCLDNPNLSDCDVLTIPHNANLSGGEMFPDPSSTENAEMQAQFEPLTEIHQHKAASECRYDRLARAGADTNDPLCTFEQALGTILGPQPNPPDIEDFPRRNMVRNVLKDGLALAPEFDGTNPFKYGIAGGTDSHNGDPSNTVEQDFQGHAGVADAPLASMINNIRFGPGSLSVVWAEENSRDAIFSAMRRKEVYATSGTRPIVRFFGGWGFDDRRMRNLCRQPDRVDVGYDNGVPMGGDLPPQTRTNPSFLIAALRDTESAPLQRIQIVKGWVDAAGETHERVFDVAGNVGRYDPRQEREICGASSTNEELYRGRGSGRKARPSRRSNGSNELCTVWTDRSFNPAQRAFYYTRVLETPTCRWSTLACLSADVDPFASQKSCEIQAAAANFKAIAAGEIEVGDTPFNNCCLTERNDPFMERTIQERAWSSPIWYTPGG